MNYKKYYFFLDLRLLVPLHICKTDQKTQDKSKYILVFFYWIIKSHTDNQVGLLQKTSLFNKNWYTMEVFIIDSFEAGQGLTVININLHVSKD